MDNSNLISIAMATYNGEKYLEKQLNSILNQSHKNIEIIICDDVSKDSTIDIINNYIKKYSFIKLFKNEKNLGYVKNFEKAINLCDSQYITLCDQDDIWEVNKLEIQLKEIKKQEKLYPRSPILIHSDLSMIDKDCKTFNTSYFKYRKYKLKKEKDLSHILGPCGVMGNTILFNKKLKNKILPFPPYIENHDYWISLINEIFGKRITLDSKLVKYRIHISNASNSENKIKSNNKRLALFQRILKRDFYIPYIHTKRFQLISYILRNFTISKVDKKVLVKFQEYLSKETTTLNKISNVIKYSFYKRDFIYRLIFLSGLIIRKNISKKNLYIYNILEIFSSKKFIGWGRKNSGKFASLCNRIFKGEITLLEDGFIRSIDLSKSLVSPYSIIEDNKGIYYDATCANDLEDILSNYDFQSDKKLMKTANEAIKLIKENYISKYNHAKHIKENYFKKDEKKILVIAQAENDKSLEYGLANQVTLENLIKIAIKENPDSKVYIKVHPDEIIKNNYKIELSKEYIIIEEDVNAISLLKYFDKVYTRTSQMGFEALLLKKECVCYGMPFYGGWGLTEDKQNIKRRKRKLSVEEIFAGAYILYSNYYNPLTNNKCTILDIINYIIERKKNEEGLN